MFLFLLIALVAAAFVHARFAGPRTAERVAELVVVYVLVGYCGLPQLALGLSMVFSSELVAHLARVTDPGELLPWMSWLYAGSGLIATLAFRLRGDYLLGPVLLWSIFFAGATYAHFHTEAAHGHMPGLHGALWIVASHGLVSVVLVAAWSLARRGTKGNGGASRAAVS